MTGVSATALTGTQTLANITFTAVGTKGASSAVTVSVPTLANPTGGALTATLGNGRIRIK